MALRVQIRALLLLLLLLLLPPPLLLLQLLQLQLTLALPAPGPAEVVADVGKREPLLAGVRLANDAGHELGDPLGLQDNKVAEERGEPHGRAHAAQEPQARLVLAPGGQAVLHRPLRELLQGQQHLAATVVVVVIGGGGGDWWWWWWW